MQCESVVEGFDPVRKGRGRSFLRKERVLTRKKVQQEQKPFGGQEQNDNVGLKEDL